MGLTYSRIAGILLSTVAVMAPRQAAGQRVGLFFDEHAVVCTSPIVPFEPNCLHVWVCAYIPPATPVGGVFLKLQLPVDIQICMDSVTYPRNLVIDHHGTLTNGVEIAFRTCIQDSSPLVVAEFDLFDSGAAPRPDLLLHLVGAPHDSVTAPLLPQIKLCDPEFPEHDLGLLNAPSVDATLNCTNNCGCTTAIRPMAWTAVKRLYQEP